MGTAREEDPVVYPEETGLQWPVNWSAAWVGALAALAIALLIGLAGIAVGAYQIAPAARIARWSDFGLGALIVAVLGAFFSFVVGGWIAGRIAGARHSERGMLHGAIAWLIAVPLLLLLMAFGAGNFFGLWYGGLAGVPTWVTPATAAVDPNAAAVARNAALGAFTGLLLGLVGSVIGGWMAAGEPMTFTYHRRREVTTRRSA